MKVKKFTFNSFKARYLLSHVVDLKVKIKMVLYPKHIWAKQWEKWHRTDCFAMDVSIKSV